MSDLTLFYFHTPDTMDKSNNIVFCDGGLSNRLNALIFALILKEKYQQPWEIAWPANNWCRARFEALFSTKLPLNQNDLSFYKNVSNKYSLVMHENQCDFPSELINFQSTFHCYDDYAKLINYGKPIFYYHNLIPTIASIQDMQIGLVNLSINKNILDLAQKFCYDNQINESVLGLHIRKTDFGATVNDQELYSVVKNSSKRFFVCSDDPEVNERFSLLPNCSVYIKTYFPEKMISDEGWNHQTKDDQGRDFFYNIERSESSIIEALIDLLILSRTTHVSTSNSTFLKMSMIFKFTNFFDSIEGDINV